MSAERAAVPPSVQYIVEKGCYLQCLFCDQPSSPESMSGRFIADGLGESLRLSAEIRAKEERITEVMQLLRKWGVNKLTLTGGEPTVLNPVFFLASARYFGFQEIALATSGQVTFWPHFLDRAEKYFDVLKLPLHGGRETHNYLTGDRLDSFSGVAATLIEFCRSHRHHLRAEVTCVVCERNVTEIPDVLKVCLATGVSQLTLSEVQNRGRGKAFLGSIPEERILEIKRQLLETYGDEITRAGLDIRVRGLGDNCVLVYTDGSVFIGGDYLGNLKRDDMRKICQESDLYREFELSYGRLHSRE